jgi:NAD(P)-dependent dehydrogenase (short-subunit alcohol dehydrogenase family)
VARCDRGQPRRHLLDAPRPGAPHNRGRDGRQTRGGLVDGRALRLADQPHYAASKGGVGALVRSLAVRLGKHGIQVNSLEPGWIETDATQMLYGNERFSDVVTRRTPLRRCGEPADLAGIAAHLASDEAAFHTGDSIRIDGGYSIL